MDRFTWFLGYMLKYILFCIKITQIGSQPAAGFTEPWNSRMNPQKLFSFWPSPQIHSSVGRKKHWFHCECGKHLKHRSEPKLSQSQRIWPRPTDAVHFIHCPSQARAHMASRKGKLPQGGLLTSVYPSLQPGKLGFLVSTKFPTSSLIQ